MGLRGYMDDRWMEELHHARERFRDDRQWHRENYRRLVLSALEVEMNEAVVRGLRRELAHVERLLGIGDKPTPETVREQTRKRVQRYRERQRVQRYRERQLAKRSA